MLTYLRIFIIFKMTISFCVKMKRVFLPFLLIFILAFMACDSGNSSGSNEAVVSLSIESSDGRITQKLVSVTTPSLEGIEFQYKATPIWRGADFTAIKGTQADWTSFTQNTSLGPFAQGLWEFSVRILSASGATLYQGATESYINSGVNSVSVSVFKQQIEGEEGTLYIEITSPTVSDNDQLVIEYGPIDNMNSGTTIVVNDNSEKTKNGGRTTFTKTITPIASGTHWVKLAYNNGVTDVGGAIAFVDIIKDETSEVTGTIEAGEWQTCTIVSTGIKSFGIIIRAAGNASSVVSGQDLDFTCTKASEEFEDIISYQWYVDGEKQSAIGSTFTFNREYDPYASNSNFYRINCIAGDSSTPQICADAIWYIVVKEAE